MRVAVVIPASGFSRRFGGVDKLLAPFGNGCVVRATVAAATASQAARVIVVRRPGADRLDAAVAGLSVRLVDNRDAGEGLAAAIRAGIGALPESVSGAAILPADLPAMSPSVIDRLIAAFKAENGLRIVVPMVAIAQGGRCATRQRNPVIWPRRYFGDLLSLAGDAGAKGMLEQVPAEDILHVGFEDASAFTDVDTPEALAALARGLRAASEDVH